MDLAALCHDVDMALQVPFENIIVIIGHSSYVLLSDDFIAGRAIVRVTSSGTRNYAPQIRIVAQLSTNLDMFGYILQSNLDISNSLISNYRLSRSEILVPVLT